MDMTTSDSTGSTINHFLQFPADMLLNIGKECTVPAFCQLVATSKKMNEIFDKEDFWKALYKENFPQIQLSVDAEGWKEHCKRNYKMLTYLKGLKGKRPIAGVCGNLNPNREIRYG
jgi:hypothetical protein